MWEMKNGSAESVAGSREDDDLLICNLDTVTLKCLLAIITVGRLR